MKARIITIGDELLIGQTIDTNSAFIGAELSSLGFDVCSKITVHDLKPDILKVLKDSVGKFDLIIITGGLGPTSDDITKPALCQFFNTRLIMNKEVLEMIESMMRKRNWQMNESNRRQAEVPESCKALKNEAGTAPGMWFEKDGTILISLPGVPYEMKYLMATYVIPELKKRFTAQVIIHRNIMTYGLGESSLSEKLAGFESSLPQEIKLAYLPAYGIVKLRLTGSGKDRGHLNDLIEAQVRKLYQIIPQQIYGENEDTFEVVIGKLLKERGESLCTAESCTGGKLATMLTSVPGSSEYYKGSVIAYDNGIKTDLLDVSESLIEKYGAVSTEVACAMAEGAMKLMKTDYSVATSGIAGPDGGTVSKPVGTVCIAVSSSHGTLAEKLVFGNDRLTNINRFSVAALSLLRKAIITA